MSAPVSPPRFSIVVPVYDVREYLPACLDSILDQFFDSDLELIAVDDASPDGSDAILDEYAARDRRVRVIHLPENVGLGPARNAGVDLATGRYLLFVDSDDMLTPGSLAAMDDRLADTDSPEVLVFDHARTDASGRVERDGKTTAMASASPGVFEFAEHPELLRLLFVAWNKAYRRDWVREQGFRFPPGYYEDAPWTYPILLSARHIAVLDRVCYQYRQRPHGNILKTRDRRHFDALDQYARVFGYLAAHPELDSWRPLMLERMMRHFVTILSDPRRLPAGTRREFFTAASAAYRHYRQPGYASPPGTSGIWARSFVRGDYRAFRAAQLAFALRHRVSAVLGDNARVTAFGRKALTRLYYEAQLRRPIQDDLVAYAAYWYRGYACSPAAIHATARELAPHLRGVWVVAPELAAAMPPGVEFVRSDSLAYLRLMARAKYFVNNVNFPHVIRKRPGTIHLQTQHGTPLKSMGLALREHPVAAQGMDFARLLQHVARWDYLTSANRHSTEVWQRSYPGSYQVLEFGLPRNDRLVNATPQDVATVRSALGLRPEQTVLLYAPTFRDWAPGGFGPALDLQALCERIGAEFTVLVRGHYLTSSDERLSRLVERAALRDVSTYPVLEDLLLAADVLMTDYSSVMFDYANLDRPIVIYAEDWDSYVRVRGVSYDLLAGPPGVVETTPNGLVDALLSGRYRDARATRARAQFARRFCEFDDGHAAERVVRRVFLDA
ncbi:MAG: CDP-glycerol glycerophosphotransferase family protein [Actinomycetota bacterium]|nr:CDP-glycerol glycerophosphotransferase family protein [Actinomycetota bacterium]